MKKISKLKIGQLNKANLEEREMNRLYGGNYCGWNDDNRDANDKADVCSCSCYYGDYYGTSGLDHEASFFKYTTAFNGGYC